MRKMTSSTQCPSHPQSTVPLFYTPTQCSLPASSSVLPPLPPSSLPPPLARARRTSFPHLPADAQTLTVHDHTVPSSSAAAAAELATPAAAGETSSAATPSEAKQKILRSPAYLDYWDLSLETSMPPCSILPTARCISR